MAAAKKEGTVVVGIPASSELRTAISAKFKEKFGIPVELMSARGPENVTRIITEYNAGVRYFDILVAGGATPLSMVAAGAADDFQSYMILPEVKDPKNWWGGHIWEDNVSGKRQIYAFLCYTSETWWYNSSQAEASEIRSFDDLAQSQMERPDRRARSAQSRLGTKHLVVSLESQRRRISDQARAAGSARQSEPAPARRCPGEGQARVHPRRQPLHLRSVHQSRTAGEDR